MNKEYELIDSCYDVIKLKTVGNADKEISIEFSSNDKDMEMNLTKEKTELLISYLEELKEML